MSLDIQVVLDDEYDLDLDYQIGEEIAKEEGWHEELRDDDSSDLAKTSMKEFFAKREYYCGGAIPHRLLFTDINIRKVIELGMEEGISEIHAMLEGQDLPDDVKPLLHEGLAWQVIYVRHLLDLCATERIPKIFAPGIILIYLDLCKGMTYQERSWNLWS